MTFMINYEFGDIVLVPFPFTDQTASKRRPDAVVSSKAYHRDYADVVLMAVTSQPRSQGKCGETVVTEWQQAGLLKPSVIKPVIATVEKQLVLRKLGRLQEQDRKALQNSIQDILAE